MPVSYIKVPVNGHGMKTAVVCGHCMRRFHMDSFHSGEVKTTEFGDEAWLCSLPCVYAWRRKLPRETGRNNRKGTTGSAAPSLAMIRETETTETTADDAFVGIVGACWADEVDAAETKARRKAHVTPVY